MKPTDKARETGIMRDRIGVVLAVMILVATLIRLPGLGRGLDQPDWRPIDTATIARNFRQEGMNPLFPRVDWRGDGPGYAEMELPIQPYLMALAYELTGPHVVVGRLLALVVSVVTLGLFASLASRRLSGRGAMVAVALVGVNPLAVELSTALQPEAFMLLGIVGAATALDRFVVGGARRYALAGAAALAFAILAKAPAAHLLLGYVFYVALAALDRRARGGSRAPLRRLTGARAATLLALACVPGAAWYAHAHTLWLAYGTSMGVSNESHTFGLALFRHPGVVLAVLRASAAHAVGWALVPLLLAGAVVARGALARCQLELAWLGAALVYLVVIGRTAGDEWATYYHIAAVPPAAMLVAAAADALVTRAASGRRRWLTATVVVGLLLAQIGLWSAAAVAAVRPRRPDPMFLDATRLRAALPEGPIVVVTDDCRDEWGGPVAYQAPYLFFWLHRKGWSLCRQDVDEAHVRALVAQGAQALVAERSPLKSAETRVQYELRAHFPVLAETYHVTLFDIRSPRHSAAVPEGAIPRGRAS